eukprot:2730985-Amphidinium_carterae.1
MTRGFAQTQRYLCTLIFMNTIHAGMLVSCSSGRADLSIQRFAYDWVLLNWSLFLEYLRNQEIKKARCRTSNTHFLFNLRKHSCALDWRRKFPFTSSPKP